MDESSTVLEELWSEYTNLTATQVRTELAKFGFIGDDVFKSVSVLSGGEKARLSICKMIMTGVSLLILDEPTNHLDIGSCEALENALMAFDGTIIAVSHDRYFVKKVAHHIFSFEDNDHISKRMTHVQLVSKISRTISRVMNGSFSRQMSLH